MTVYSTAVCSRNKHMSLLFLLVLHSPHLCHMSWAATSILSLPDSLMMAPAQIHHFPRRWRSLKDRLWSRLCQTSLLQPVHICHANKFDKPRCYRALPTSCEAEYIWLVLAMDNLPAGPHDP